MDGYLSQLLRLCDQSDVLALATRTPDGLPSVAPLYFAHTQDLRFFFLSSLKSEHSGNLRLDSRASASIVPIADGDLAWKAVEMTGKGSLADGRMAEEGWEVYLRRFGFLSSLAFAVLKTEMHVFLPEWVWLIDKGLGKEASVGFPLPPFEFRSRPKVLGRFKATPTIR